MAIARLFKWNALVLISFFLIACSDSGGGSGSSRGLETPIGHSIIEGNEGTSVLTLYFISPVDGPLTYSTFNITAAEKSDYELLADTFQAEKDKEYAFDVIVYGDTQIEGDESLGINFKNAQGESVGTIIGSIINDDYPGLSVTSPQVIEGDTGTPKLVFTFALSAAVVDDYSITVSSIGESGSVPSAFANLATPEIDFLPVSQELVFKSGELEKQLEVSVYADNLIENDETVVLKVLREDQPKLAELYASGIIRTDETPEINGFQLSVKDGEQQTDITEGSSINPFELTWKKIDYEITVSKPQNILQEQNLVFTLLPFTEAQTQYGVTYEKQNYVNLTDSHDLCFNDLSLDNALECQTSLNYILKQDEASFVVSIYVKEDITRELSEIFIMNIGNDQNVLFSNFQAKIINDDSENLQIKIGDEFVDLKTFTSNQSVYELTEPRAATQGTAKVIEENTLTFRLNSPLDIKYSPEYELNKYFKERPADNGEYSYADENKTLIFSTDREAPQDVTLGINLESDGTYDGDKYITLTFKETDISPLIIKIIDSDYPKLEATTKQAGVNQDSIVDNGFSYIELLEQPNAESKANEDGFMEYQYTLSQGVAAEPLLSDIRYKVTLQNTGIGKGEALPELTCLSPGHTQEYNLATLTGDDSDVSIFDNKGTQIPSGGEILLEEGATSYDLTIRVKNDAAIECQEVFQLTVVPALAPDDIQAEVALSQNFIIKDTDKALVTVQSWQTAETDAATKTQNFQFNANKKVNAILTPILMGQGLNCNADDLNPPVDAATTVSFTPDSLEPTFPIYIKGDITVEPNEACELKIGTLSADLETLIEVQYLDSTGVVIENGEYATGVIANDDKLNIGIVTTDVTEPAKGALNISVGTYSWDKKIAPNVGKIAIKATPTACTGLQNCVEDSDTTLGLHDANPVEAKEIVIHKGDETAILLPSPSTDLPISIIGDDIVEEIETLNFSVAQSAGGEYIREISDTDVSINITSEDRLLVYLDEKLDTCPDDGSEQDCTKEFEVKYSATNIDGVLTDLDVALELSNANTLKLKQSSNDEDFYDATVFIKYGGGTYAEVYPNSGKIVVNLIDNKADLLPIIKVEFRADNVVELDEKLMLDLIKDTTSDLYAISTETNKALIEQEVNNADFINVVVKGGREINEPASQVAPFTLTWLEDIDIESDADLPVLTYRIQATCFGSSTIECLSTDSDYVLQKDINGVDLTESSILLKSVSKEISMDYFQLLPADNLVELPELINFTILNNSSLIASITHDNDTLKTGDDFIGVIDPVSDIVTNLDWSLKVLSQEKLSLAAVSDSTEFHERCDINDEACTATKTVATIGLTGDVQVANNGPTIILDIANNCVISGGGNNSNNCALSSTDPNANGSEKDYVFNHSNNQLVLHTYKEAFSAASKNIQIQVSDDDWVEVTENINLNLTPTANSNNYIAKVSGQDWSYTQDITLLSEDKADINLIRDTAASTCKFAAGTTNFTEDSSNNTVSCISEYDLSTTHPIAKEVEHLDVQLLRGNSTSEKFVFKQDASSTVYDATLSLAGTETYESNEIRIHTQGTITNTGVISPLRAIYQPDSLVEVDETLHYSLEKVTTNTLYFIDSINNKINETILNNDYIDIEIIGNNTLQEPSASIKPYSVTWNNQLELPAVNLPTLTFSVGTCSGNSSLECMDTGDYTLGSSVLTLANGLPKSATIDYLTLKSDNDVELPEKVNLSLESSESAYIRSIVHTNDVSGESINTNTSATESADVFSLGWSLIVNSEDRLTVTLENPESALNESCDTNTNPTCATVKTGTLKVGGTVATNGPTISLNVANTCSVDTNNTNHCAFEADDDSIKSSEHDYIFSTGKGDYVVHRYNTSYAWTGQDIEVTLLNDDWVEVPELINLAYTAGDGSGYIDTLPINQEITINSEDKTEISISRNAATSSCQFITATTTFNEFDCNDKSSQYDLAITNSIAKEVETIEVALDLSASTNTLTYKKIDTEKSGFDVAAFINSGFMVPDGNKKLYLPVHTKNSATEKNTQLKTDNFTSNVTFKYLDDSDAEPRETLDLKLEPNPGSLYTIAAGNEGAASETIIDDDSVKFWLTTATNQEVTEKDTNDSNNTKLSYALNWGDTILADVEKLTFDFEPISNKQTTATWNVDYKITESSNLITIKNDGTTIEFDNLNADVPAGGITLTVEIIGDELVEIDETISATLSISDTYTSQLAAVGNDNVAVNVTIPNDDFVTVALYGINEADEGNDSVTDLVTPFSYSIDKSIAANVPTIEVYMDPSICVSGPTINCAEYTYADPTPESNDYSFGAVAATQMITVHQGPVMDAQGELEFAGIYTEKSAIDTNTGEIIKTEVPLNFVTDNRVEAHETLAIKFNKGDNSGTANTNVEGREFIKTLIDAALPVPSGSINILSMSTQIKNDDKIKLYITQTEDTCTLAVENNEPVCDFEINWFDPTFDIQPVIESVGSSNTAEESLANLITNAQTKDAEADTAAEKIQQRNRDVWDDESEVKDAKSAASTALTNATSAKMLAEIAITGANDAITGAEFALLLAENNSSKAVASHAKNAALAAKSAANEAKQSIIAAQDASNAALAAVSAATRAKNDNGGNVLGPWTKYDAALDAANAASAAANSATNQAKNVIVIANTTTSLALEAIKEAQGTATNPVVDNDAGEISLAMTRSGDAKYEATPKSDSDDTTIDPKDYEVTFEDESGGATSVQTTSVVLKQANEAMAVLPRTLSINVSNDNFMEPNETVNVNLTAITQAQAHEYINVFGGLRYTSDILANDTTKITVKNENASSGTEGNNTDTEFMYPVGLSNPIAKNASSISLRVVPTVPGGDGKIGSVMAADADDYTISNLDIHTYDSSATLDDTSLSLTIKSDNALELDELIQLNLSLNLGSLDTEGGINQINYTIENDDAVIVNITSATSGLESVTSNTVTYTLNNENIPKQNTEIIIADNYPSINISHTTTGSTASGSDFTAPSDFDIHTIGSEKSNGDSVEKTLSINNDSVVEKDETVTLTFSDSVDVTFNVNGSASNSLSYVISNNDYISIEYRCSDTETPCNGSLEESGSNTQMKAVITAAYETQGLSSDDRTFAFTQGLAATVDAASSSDYIIGTVELPISVSAVNLDSENARLTNAITIVENDNIIEKTEHFNLVLPDNKYIQAQSAPTAFTITNSDFLTVNLETTEPTTDTTNYNLNVCRPVGKTIEGGNITLTTSLSKVEDDLYQVIDDVTHLSCADIGLASGSSPECKDDTEGKIAEFEKIISTGDILECDTTGTTLFTFTPHNSIQPNKWFNIEVTTDERCDITSTDSCIDSTDVIVQNNELTNVLDTGITQCLQGRDKRWAGDCTTVDDGTLVGPVDYQKQDAAQTTGENNVYPALAYTYVNETGQPVAAKPDPDLVKACVQDNNTGFIWSATVLDSSNGNKNIRAYTEAAGLSERDNYDCDIADDAGKSWQLPSVQELMTILDAEKLKTARELGIKFTNEVGEDVSGSPQFYTDLAYDSANYWTSTDCDTGNGYFVLNFLNGELTCAANDEAHSIMMVYKQN
ncbi:MAG: DUF1566 domain-containing protein [Bermanella sp.]